MLPIGAPPLRDGWVAIEGDRVVAYGADSERGEWAPPAARDIDLGAVAILPGLVNAHTHLELSHLGGRVPGGQSFVSWIRAVMTARRDHPDPTAVAILGGIDDGIAQAIRCGTVAVGDISNTLATCAPLAASGLDGVVFHEIIGFNPQDPIALVDRAREAIGVAMARDRCRASMAAHAPYSVAPAVLRAIAAVVDRDSLICSVHVAESPEEVEFLQTGEGPWRKLRRTGRGILPGWRQASAPSISGRSGVIVSSGDGCSWRANERRRSDRLAARGDAWSPAREAMHTGAKRRPSNVSTRRECRWPSARTAASTDLNGSCGVGGDAGRWLATCPRRSCSTAPRVGARALGLDADYGTIAPGKRARLVTVDVPAGTGDVEEYLVSGVHQEQIAWLTVDG